MSAMIAGSTESVDSMFNRLGIVVPCSANS